MTEQRAPPKPKTPAREMFEALLFALVVSTAVMILLLYLGVKGG